MARPYASAELKEAITLRQGGYSLSAIVEQTGISASTLHRTFKTHRIGKGSIISEAAEKARQQLIADADFVGSLRHHISASIIDDLTLAQRIKAAALLALEEVEEDSATPPTAKARTLAALATAVKVSSDIQRRALRLDDPTALIQSDDLPVLTITRMTNEEIEGVRRRFDDEALTED